MLAVLSFVQFLTQHKHNNKNAYINVGNIFFSVVDTDGNYRVLAFVFTVVMDIHHFLRKFREFLLPPFFCSAYMIMN